MDTHQQEKTGWKLRNRYKPEILNTTGQHQEPEVWGCSLMALERAESFAQVESVSAFLPAERANSLGRATAENSQQ